MLDVREVVRRLRLGERERRIARDLSTSRNTVAKCRKWAEEAGFLEAIELPDLATILARLKLLDQAGQALCGPASKAEPRSIGEAGGHAMLRIASTWTTAELLPVVATKDG